MRSGAGSPASEPAAIAVAASGGLDSTALLHCVQSLARPHGLRVHALHVNHGLHPDASAWQRQVARQCARWRACGSDLVFHACRITSRPSRGESVEAWARRERYAALTQMAREAGCAIVLLAQHRRDQAETVLLQALRGAGPAGLAGMPREAERDGVLWVRPWLGLAREAIEAYVRRWRLKHVEDPSNASMRFARNRIRQRLLPAMRECFPDAEASLSSVAARAAEAAAVLHEMAIEDAARCTDQGGLRISRWLGLGDARRANLLRHWIGELVDGPVPETLVRRLLEEVPGCRAGRWPLGTQELRLHRDLLQVGRGAETVSLVPRAVDLSAPGRYDLAPWKGRLRILPTRGAGVSSALLRCAELRPRVGGEQFQRAGGVPRSLKKQYQAQGVPPWAREGPLVFAGDRLVFVPGLGTDARCLDRDSPGRVSIVWEP